MKFMTLSQGDAEEIAMLDEGEVLNYLFKDELTDKVQYIIVKTEPWMEAISGQKKTVIFQDEHGDFYKLKCSRRGSDYSEWSPTFALKCPQVQRKERIITEVYYE